MKKSRDIKSLLVLLSDILITSFFQFSKSRWYLIQFFKEKKSWNNKKSYVCPLNFCCFVLYLYKLLISLSPRHIFLSRFNVKWGHYSYIPLSLVSTIGANYFWTRIWDFTPLQFHEMFSNFHTLGCIWNLQSSSFVFPQHLYFLTYNPFWYWNC